LIHEPLLNMPLGTKIGEWSVESLPDHLFFQEGPGLREWQWSETGMKVINGRNILPDGTINTSNTERFISMDEFNKRYSHFAIETGDIVLTSSGTIGKVSRIKQEHLPLMMNTSVIRFHPKPTAKVDPSFLYQFFRSRLFLDQAESFAVGSAQQNFGPAHLRQMRILLPPLAVQRKIAAVLSTYDDLIGNNTRRIQIVEEMAQALYREWFVHFRFPGHEQSKMKAATMGPIPEGWTATTVGVVSTFVGRGISPSYDETAEGLVINQKCIRDGRLNLALARKQSKPFSPDRLVRFGDVLINSTGIGTLGRVAQVYQDVGHCTVDSHVTIARPGSDVNVDYFGFQLLGMQAHFDSLGVGSTGQTELARERVAASPFLLPPLPRQDEFGEAVQDMRKIAILCERRNQNLRQTRDLLLPKLISGEVAVDDLDIQTGELT